MAKKPAPVPTLSGLKIDKKKLTDRQQRILAQLVIKNRLLAQVQKVEEAIEAEKDENTLIREQVQALATRTSTKKSANDGRGCSVCQLKGTRLTALAKQKLGKQHSQDEHKKFIAENQGSSQALA